MSGNDPQSNPVQSTLMDIPEYFEKCYFEYLGRSQWRKFPNLGSVLDAQLRYQGKATICTQTNWKWRKMAERWGHAKLLKPTDVIHADELADRLREELFLLRKVTSNDKIVDTSDLEFDPYEPTMVYTHRTSAAFSSYAPPNLKDIVKRIADQWKNASMHKHKKTSKGSIGGEKHAESELKPKITKLSEET